MAVTGMAGQAASPTLEARTQQLLEVLLSSHGVLNDIFPVGADGVVQEPKANPGAAATIDQCIAEARNLRDRLQALSGQLGRL